jgi:hypothetical protein
MGWGKNHALSRNIRWLVLIQRRQLKGWRLASVAVTLLKRRVVSRRVASCRVVCASHWCCKAPINPCWGPGWENSPRCGGPLPAAAAAMAAANRGGMRPAAGAPWAAGPPNKAKDGGKRGRAESRNFSISASCSRFAFARRFWNQIFTCNAKQVEASLLTVKTSSHGGLWWTKWDKVTRGRLHGPVPSSLFVSTLLLSICNKQKQTNKQTPWPLVRKWNIRTELPPLVDEIWMPTFVDRGVSRGQRGGSPMAVNLNVLDWSRYFSFN